MKETVEVWFDGSCGPKNPGGKIGWGFVILYNGAERVRESHSAPAHPGNSNNRAEYLALRAALDWLWRHGLSVEAIRVRGDSSLVIRQMKGEWRIKPGRRYSAVARDAKELARCFRHLTFEWVSRRENQLADKLSRAS